MSSTGVALDRVIAIVNEGIVLQSQLDTQTALIEDRLRGQGTQMPPADVIRQQVLERLILQEIQVQRATRLGVQVPDEMLNEALRDVAKRNKIPFEQMPAALEAQGVDYASYREEMRREIMLSMLRQRDVYPRIYVSPRELDQALERDAGQSGVNTEYDVSHLLLSLPESATAEEMAKVEDLARDIRRRATRARTSASSRSPTRRRSPRSSAASSAGAAGPAARSSSRDLVVEARARARSASPVRTPTGFHLVRLDGTRGGESGPVMVEQVHARHILMRPNEVQDDATTRQRLEAIRDRILAGEDFGALASVTSEDPGSASRGGDLGWSAPGTFDPAFEEVLARRSRTTRSASRSARSSAGISSSCWASARTTRATSCAASAC